jgi:hypothetical protein
VIFERLTQDEPEEERRWFEAVHAQNVAECAEAGAEQQIERAMIRRIRADAREHDRGRVEKAIRNQEQSAPDADERQVDHEQHEVANPHARDEPPEERRLLRDDAGSGLNAVHDERAQEHRHHRVRGEPERQERDERCLRRRVVGRLRTGDTFNRALTERRRWRNQHRDNTARRPAYLNQPVAPQAWRAHFSTCRAPSPELS